MVVGNSGVDIACEVSRVAEATLLSTRRSAHIVPKYVWGMAIDKLTTPAASHLPLWLQNFFFTPSGSDAAPASPTPTFGIAVLGSGLDVAEMPDDDEETSDEHGNRTNHHFHARPASRAR